MTDEERIAELYETAGNATQIVQVRKDHLRWLLGEYRRDHADAARWRHCERVAEPSDGNDAEPWWVLTVRGPTFAEAVDAAIAKEVTTD